jgi:DNA-binding response OmpR family regulator
MRERILMVEDEQALQMVVGDRLRKDGYLVDSASDGETGFRKATSQPFDLVILDVMLPRRSGLDLCRDVRLAGLGMPVLILTARCGSEDVVAGLKAGADAYMTKPFELAELSARVEALLRRAPSQRFGIRGAQPTSSVSREACVAPELVTVSDQPPDAAQQQQLWEGVVEHFTSPEASAQLAEVIPQLRALLTEARPQPQTPLDVADLSMAEGVVEFLEEIFQGVRSRMPRGSKKI